MASSNSITSIYLIALSAVVFLLAFTSAVDAGGEFSKLGKRLRHFSVKKQDDLDQKGDAAIAKVKSSMKKSDLDRIFRLKTAVLSKCPPDQWKVIQSEVPGTALAGGVALIIRHELGIFYANQKIIELEEFERIFNENIISNCQQFQSKLDKWLKETSSGNYAPNDKFEWLVSANICQKIVHSAKRPEEFLYLVYKEFKHSLNFDIVQMCNYEPPKLAARVDLIMRTVEPIDVARLNLLRSCIILKGPDVSRMEPLEQIPEERLVRGLAAVMRIETGHPETAPEKAQIDQLIESKLFKPCKAIHGEFKGELEQGDDPRWAKVEGLCLTFAKLIESGESSKLLERVYIEYGRQLEADQSDFELRDSESMRLISM